MENLHLIHKIRTIYWKIKYRQGKIVSQFVAPDIRRDVVVVDSSEIENGYILAKIRTWNVLYDIKGIEKKPDFGDVKRLKIKTCGTGWGNLGEAWFRNEQRKRKRVTSLKNHVSNYHDLVHEVTKRGYL